MNWSIFRFAGAVASVTRHSCLRALGVAHVGVIDVHPVDDDTAVDIRQIKSPGKTRFAYRYVQHRIIQVGGEGNARAEADFRLFSVALGNPRRQRSRRRPVCGSLLAQRALRGEVTLVIIGVVA